MKLHRTFAMTLIAAGILAGCNTMPATNSALEQARSDYRFAQDNAQVRDLAGAELKQAADTLAKADESMTKHGNSPEATHLAYLAKQQVAIAQETARQKSAEVAVTNANLARDKVRLAARTNEADAAKASAESSQRQSEESMRQSALAKQQADAARLQADASRLQADASQRQANDAQARNMDLEAQLRDLNAKKTDRGMVITIGDVLFATNKADLKSGGMRSVDKLVGFMNQNPQRKAMIEGFTDSTGSDATNRELSDRRANAVRTALLDRGVGRDRLDTRGYGDAYPVANNDSADGRQMNRRVEIILSDDKGNIVPR